MDRVYGYSTGQNRYFVLSQQNTRVTATEDIGGPNILPVFIYAHDDEWGRYAPPHAPRPNQNGGLTPSLNH